MQTDIVLLGNGDGTFTQGQILQSTSGFINGALVDVNGDKHLDLIATDGYDVELGDGKGNFHQVVPPGSYSSNPNTGLTVGDFNGDGHIDFLTAAYDSGAVQFTAGNGDGTFQPPSSLVSGTSSYGLILSSGDFNKDGKLDFVLSGVDFASVFLNQGNGTFPSTLNATEPLAIGLPYTGGIPGPPSSTNPPITAVADLDGNGALDIAVADDNSSGSVCF